MNVSLSSQLSPLTNMGWSQKYWAGFFSPSLWLLAVIVSLFGVAYCRHQVIRQHVRLEQLSTTHAGLMRDYEQSKLHWSSFKQPMEFEQIAMSQGFESAAGQKVDFIEKLS